MTTSAIDNVEQVSDEPTTPIKRKAILEMALAEKVAVLEAIRVRRFALVSFIQRARSANSTKKLETLYNKTELAINKLGTQAIRMEGLLAKADDDVNKIRVMLLEMGELMKVGD